MNDELKNGGRQVEDKGLFAFSVDCIDKGKVGWQHQSQA
jgi:hypothetical protein